MNRIWMEMAAFTIGSLLTSSSASAASAETVVPIKVLVLLKDKAQDGPRPFPNVGGIVIRRLREDLKNASCPDVSNEKGELTCRLKCLKDDPDLRLKVVAPLKAQAPIVAGMSPPPAATLNIEKCLVRKDPATMQGASIRLVYRTALAMADELRAEAPEVFAAVATAKGNSLSFKPLEQTAPVLRQLAKNPANRAQLERLAELGDVYNEAVQARKNTMLGPTLSEYASGAKSIVLQAAVTDSMGGNADRLVTVSPSKAELHRSIAKVSRALNEKAVLSSPEIVLARDVSELKQEKAERPPGPEKAYYDTTPSIDVHPKTQAKK